MYFLSEAIMLMVIDRQITKHAKLGSTIGQRYRKPTKYLFVLSLDIANLIFNEFLIALPKGAFWFESRKGVLG